MADPTPKLLESLAFPRRVLGMHGRLVPSGSGSERLACRIAAAQSGAQGFCSLEADGQLLRLPSHWQTGAELLEIGTRDGLEDSAQRSSWLLCPERFRVGHVALESAYARGRFVRALPGGELRCEFPDRSEAFADEASFRFVEIVDVQQATVGKSASVSQTKFLGAAARSMKGGADAFAPCPNPCPNPFGDGGDETGDREKALEVLRGVLGPDALRDFGIQNF
mmetsp:Transcript_76272/g.135101  ORF Transcript_76272/g.135101 Transcript_76272/m.135101 type:complete len:223 (-) Transcript_76272:36-704(-)